MDSQGLTFVQSVIVGVAAGLVSAFSTSFLASRGFRHQRWWERRSQAYEDTAGQLLHLKLQAADEAREQIAESAGTQALPLAAEFAAATQRAAQDAGRAIERRIAEGQLFLSKPAVRLLEQYRVDATTAIYEDVTGNQQEWRFSVANRYHRDFVERAQVDLRAPWWILRLVAIYFRRVKQWFQIGVAFLDNDWRSEAFTTTRERGPFRWGVALGKVESWQPPYKPWEYGDILQKPRNEFLI